MTTPTSDAVEREVRIAARPETSFLSSPTRPRWSSGWAQKRSWTHAQAESTG